MFLYLQIDEIKVTYKTQREQVDEKFNEIFLMAVAMAESIGIEPSKPRVTVRQEHQTNTPSGSVQEFYKRNTVIPLLDHIIASLEAKFSS